MPGLPTAVRFFIAFRVVQRKCHFLRKRIAKSTLGPTAEPPGGMRRHVLPLFR